MNVEYMRELMREKGFNHATLAAACEVDRTTITKMLSKASTPHLKTFRRIVETLGADGNKLFDGNHHEHPA
jgi:DNA-binding phage protein